MSPAQNPLYLFGLLPDFVRATPGELRPALFKAQYRALAAFYHPDKETGDSRRSRQLNEAWDRVNPETNPDEFERWLDQFLVERKTALAQAEERIASQQAELLSLRSEALNRLINLAIMGDKAWSGKSHSSDKGELIQEGDQLVPLWRISSATILVMNRHVSLGDGSKLPKDREWLHPDLFALKITPSGEILTCGVRQIWKKQRDEILPPGIPGSANYSLNWHNRHVMRLEGEFTQRLPKTLRIIGSVAQAVVDQVTHRYQKRRETDLRLLMMQAKKSEGAVPRSADVLVGLSDDEALEIARSVEPWIRRSSYILAGEYHPGGEEEAKSEGPCPRFYVLGTVRTPPALDYQQQAIL